MFGCGLSTTKSVTSLLMTHHLDHDIFASLFGEGKNFLEKLKF